MELRTLQGDPMRATVYVVDDDEAVRDSLQFVLEGEGFEVRTYEGAGALLRAELSPAGCVLTDFHMPGIDGLELQARLTKASIHLPVIVMTGHSEVPIAVRAMKAGAVDFLEKPFEDGQLLQAVKQALSRNQVRLAAEGRRARAAELIACLTPREQEVLELLVLGRSHKEIGKSLGTSPRTIDVHRAHIHAKLGATTLPDLVHLVLAADAGPTGG